MLQILEESLVKCRRFPRTMGRPPKFNPRYGMYKIGREEDTEEATVTKVLSILAEYQVFAAWRVR